MIICNASNTSLLFLPVNAALEKETSSKAQIYTQMGCREHQVLDGLQLHISKYEVWVTGCSNIELL